MQPFRECTLRHRGLSPRPGGPRTHIARSARLRVRAALLVLPEHHAGLDAPPRQVAFALHTVLHHTGNHYTAHGFVANGDDAPFSFFHDANARPLTRPSERNALGILKYAHKVTCAWYHRVGVVD